LKRQGRRRPLSLTLIGGILAFPALASDGTVEDAVVKGTAIGK
jgi:hypothetical protein